MKVFLAAGGLIVETAGKFHALPPALDLDRLFSAADPGALLRAALPAAPHLASLPPARAPLQSQEVWAAGVTYLNSRSARMAESKAAGDRSFYDRVYSADRPELFFKSTAHRVASPGEPVRLRRDSRWNVPEPELTLAISAHGRIFGYTIGNDMSSRDIEGENPLYLPQAKVYDRSAALGPCLLMTGTGIVPPDGFTLQSGDEITITIPPIGTLLNPVA